MIGIESGKAELRDYSSEYKMIAEKTINQLENIIGTKVLKIKHVGSTAIIGIKAKPIIDIAVGVSSFEIIPKIKPVLEKNGFLYSKTKLNNTVVTFMCEEEGKRTHNIHFVLFNGERWYEFVGFKNYLNAHPEAAKAYEALKVELSKKNPDDVHKYTESKNDFIKDVLNQAEKEGFVRKEI